MKVFFETYRIHLTYAICVLAAVFVLYLLTNRLHYWLVKKEKKKYPGETTTPVNLVKWVLNSLWMILGYLAMNFIFVEKVEYGRLEDHFKQALYLGFLAVITIIGATASDLWFRKAIRTKIENNDDPTAFKFLRYVAILLFCSLGCLFSLFAFPSLRGIAQTALGGAGVLTLILGIASQEALSNVIGGIFIISFKPFRIGDIVKVSDTMVGKVSDITLRHTVIRNFENKMIVIPNAVINSEKLINYDLGELMCCEHIEVGISYESDVELAKKILQEECENHPLIYDKRSETEADNPIVRTAVTKLNESSVTIRAWAWAKNYGDSFDLKCSVLENVLKRFSAEGIEIAYPHRTIVMKKGLENEG